MKTHPVSRLLAAAFIATASYSTMPAHAVDDVPALKEKIEIREEVIAALKKQNAELKKKLAEKDAEIEKISIGLGKQKDSQHTPVAKSDGVAASSDSKFIALEEWEKEMVLFYAKAYDEMKKIKLEQLKLKAGKTVEYRTVTNNLGHGLSETHKEISNVNTPSKQDSDDARESIKKISKDEVHIIGFMETEGFNNPSDKRFLEMHKRMGGWYSCDFVKVISVIDDHSLLVQKTVRVADDLPDGFLKVSDGDIFCIDRVDAKKYADGDEPMFHIFQPCQSSNFSYVSSNGARRTVHRYFSYDPQEIHDAALLIRANKKDKKKAN